MDVKGYRFIEINISIHMEAHMTTIAIANQKGGVGRRQLQSHFLLHSQDVERKSWSLIQIRKEI